MLVGIALTAISQVPTERSIVRFSLVLASPSHSGLTLVSYVAALRELEEAVRRYSRSPPLLLTVEPQYVHFNAQPFRTVLRRSPWVQFTLLARPAGGVPKSVMYTES